MHPSIHPAVSKSSLTVPEFAGAERFLLAACVFLMAMAVFLRNFDDPLLRAVYGLTSAENIAIWGAVSRLGSGFTLTPVVAAVTLVLLWRGQSMSALALALGWAATSLTVEYLQWLLDRSRPSFTPLFAAGSSFPSAHAAHAAFVYCSLALGFPGRVMLAGRVGGWIWRMRWIVCVGLAAATGYSRLALGLHWPSDVMAGWAVGLFFCALTLVLRNPCPVPAPVGLGRAGDGPHDGS